MLANDTSGFLSLKNINIHFASSHFLVICFLDYRSTLDPQQLKTSKFEWMLDNIRIEKIILTPIWAINVFWRFQLYYVLDIVPNCTLVQYKEKPWENGKNPNLWPNFGPAKFFSWVLPVLVVRQCFKLSSYAISRKNN